MNVSFLNFYKNWKEYKKQSQSVSFNFQTPRSCSKKVVRASFFQAAHSQCLSVLDILHLRLIWWGVKEPSGILKLTAEHNKRQSDPFRNTRRDNRWKLLMHNFIQECSTFCPWAEVSLRGFIVGSPLILSLVSSRPWWMGKYDVTNWADPQPALQAGRKDKGEHAATSLEF